MAKFYENIGFAISTEVKPGIWKDVIQTYPYYGEITRNVRSLQQANQLNDNINISNEFSIVADPFARKNFHSMRYITYMGTKWKITNVDAGQYPRLILTVGGVYNG